MAAPIALLRKPEKYKLDADSLSKYFKAPTKSGSMSDKLVNNIRDCIRDGIDRNRRDYRLFKAMDWAMDQPFYQISYTQLRGLLSSQPDDKKVLETVNSWGLAHLLPDQINSDGSPCCGTDGKPKKAINLPFLTNIFIPVVMAYHTIRWAKLFNDRNLHPLYKYEPVQFTKENRLRCEIVTQLIQRQADWFDYKADLRQNIFQTLQYGVAVNLPREAWFVEKQLGEDGKESIVREGLRFNMPHPSRLYYDLYHRLSSLNSNSGCEYVGYWEVVRYKTINDNKLYWNKDKIQVGASASWFDIGRSDFLNTVYPCNLSFPSGNGSGGVGALDREQEAATFYSQTDANAATLLTQHFHRIVPADWDMGDYKFPIWMRFVFASDNAVLWAEPLAYDRFPTYAYDADFNRSRFRSLSLEVVPFQDQIGNILSQWNAAVRENLRNPVFVDKEKVPTNALIALQNRGNKFYDGREYIPFSSTENYRMRVDQKEAFFTPTMTHHTTSELAQILTAFLDMLDRVLQMSPQEIGQAASHEQTAEESRIIDRNITNRVSFTGSFIDDAEHAKKVMLYDATMAYADDEIIVGVSTSITSTDEELKKLCEKLGLTVEDDTDYDPTATVRTVKGKKSAIRMENFSAKREGESRINTGAVADAMSKIFTAVAGNPVLVQSIGASQLVELMNQIIAASGTLPKEFRLQGKDIDTTAPQEEQQAQFQDLITKFSEQVRQAIDQSQQQTLQAAAQQTQQIVEQSMAGAAEQIAPLAEAVAQANQVNQVQEQKLDVLAESVAKLNEAIVAAVQSAQPPVPPPGPLQVAPEGAIPIGVPV